MKREKSDNLILPLQHLHHEYLRDESRSAGEAESISFPQSETQIQAIVNTLSKQQTPITVQGSRTGIAGGAVPIRGHIMNLSKMTGVKGMEQDSNGNFLIRVHPGITLSDLDHQLSSRGFDSEAWDKKDKDVLSAFKKAGRHFWPPDPSEDSASVGGIATNNSRGICALHYGPACHHIKHIRVIDGNGQLHSLGRGEYVFSKGICPLPGGGTLQVDPASLNTESTMDLMDIYLGSQGVLGVITELTLALQLLPSELWGIVFFFKDQSQAVDFIESVIHTYRHTHGQTHGKRHGKRQKTDDDMDIVAIEFMDQTTLESIEKFKQSNTRLRKLPDWNKDIESAVYLEIHGNSPDEMDALSGWLLEKAEEYGSDPESTWAACGKAEVEQLRLFRHAAPETVNQLIDKARQKDSRITKLGTDMALKNSSLSELIDMYAKDLSTFGLKAAIFGHAADRHLHVNILPKDFVEYEQGKRLIEKWAITINAKGGSIVTEHGVGKIKKYLFQSIPLPRYLKLICEIKQQLDPSGIWNPGNIPDSVEQS